MVFLKMNTEIAIIMRRKEQSNRIKYIGTRDTAIGSSTSGEGQSNRINYIVGGVQSNKYIGGGVQSSRIKHMGK